MVPKLLEGEFRTLQRWAEDVQEKLGPKVDLTFVRRYNVPPLMLIAEYDIRTELASDLVKQCVREEADKYRRGRLYFMAYDRRLGKLYLQFYSFYLGDTVETGTAAV